MDRVAYTQQKSNSHSSGNWKFEIRVPIWSGEGPLQGCRLLVFSHDKRTRDLSGAPFICKGTNSIQRATPSNLSTSKAPPISTITSSIRISTYVFLGGYKHSDHSIKYKGLRVGWERQTLTIIPCIYQ